MPDSKISDLVAVAAVVAAQEFAVNDALASRKASAAQIADFLFKRIAGSSGAAGEHITLQRLTANSADQTDGYLLEDGTGVLILEQQVGADPFKQSEWLNLPRRKQRGARHRRASSCGCSEAPY